MRKCNYEYMLPHEIDEAVVEFPWRMCLSEPSSGTGNTWRWGTIR